MWTMPPKKSGKGGGKRWMWMCDSDQRVLTEVLARGGLAPIRALSPGVRDSGRGSDVIRETEINGSYRCRSDNHKLSRPTSIGWDLS